MRRLSKATSHLLVDGLLVLLLPVSVLKVRVKPLGHGSSQGQ